jgi:hypothetical protein
MATGATSKPTRTRKPCPADVCRLTVTIRGESYGVRPIRPEAADVARAWRLRRRDGTSYVVADTIHGATCECGDFIFRHDGIEDLGCKHIRAARALGLIDPDGDGPDDWPSWTDTVAFTTAR